MQTIKNQSEYAELVEQYINKQNYVHRVRQGYRTHKESQFDKEPRVLFSSHTKRNPHTKKRWSYHENK